MGSKPPGWVRGETDATLHRGARRTLDGLLERACGPWIYAGTLGNGDVTDDNLLSEISPPFQNGVTNVLGGKVPLRFRWQLGGGIEVQGCVSIPTANVKIIDLPAGYFEPGAYIPLHGHDEAGAYRAWHIDDGGLFDGV